jgi:hypothetical protein
LVATSPFHFRHIDIHHNKLGAQLSNRSDSLCTIISFPYDIDVLSACQQATNAFSHHAVIIHEQHTNSTLLSCHELSPFDE